MSENPGAEPKGDAFTPKAGVVVAHKYRLDKRIQRGGMGEVWIATHTALDTQVAIKFMTAKVVDAPPQPGPGADGAVTEDGVLTRVRFEREAKAAARIRSSNVVQILDHGVDHDTPYIVMELLRGEDLGARLRLYGRLSVKEMVPIVTAVAKALQMAHAEGLVHRDLKPENIFLAKEGDEEIPKVLDFGVAKAKAVPGDQPVDGATTQGVVLGTPSYMSPEQIQGSDKLDHRSDLWSLGVVIYRALTGQLPFPGAMLLELAVQVCSAPIPKATSIVPVLDPSVDAFFEKALCRDLAGRFQSARELAVAFHTLAQTTGGMRAQLPSWKDKLPTPGPVRAVARSSGTASQHAVTVEDKPSEGKPAEPKVLPEKPARSKAPMVVMLVALAAVLIGVSVTFLRKTSVAPTDSAAASQAEPSPKPAETSEPVRAPAATAPAASVPAAESATVAAQVPSASASAAPKTTTSKQPSIKPTSTSTAKPESTTKKRNVGY